MTASTILILGESGTGKSRSMKHLDPTNTLLIQTLPKRLPFPMGDGWKYYEQDKNGGGNGGNIIVTDNTDLICSLMGKTKKRIIIIDDVQFVMSNDLMRKVDIKGYDKFNEIARNIQQIMAKAASLGNDTRVYFMWHPDINDDGFVTTKTVGKLTEKINTPPGFFIVCLMTERIVDGQDVSYHFRTRPRANDPVKVPEGIFEDYYIPNDLELVDSRLCEMWQIERKGK